MSVGDAKEFLGQQLRLPGDLADAEIDRYLAYPTPAASYLVGANEIESIVAEVTESGLSTLHAHGALTSAGSLPLPIARRVAGL